MATFSVAFLGCKVSHVDAHAVRERLLGEGHSEQTGSDVAVLNTCCVTHEAVSKSRKAASRLARCPSVPSDLATIIEQQASALVGAAQHARDVELPYVEGQCKRVRDQITLTVQQSGCPLM